MTTDGPDQLPCRHLAGSLPAFLLAGCLVAASAAGLGLPAAQGAEPEVLLERVDKVYADGKWNGRLSVVPFLGRYYAFFRSAVAHDQDGAIRVITSIGNSTTRWSSSPYAQLNYEATLKAGKSLDPIAHGPKARVLFDTELDESEMHVVATPQRMFGYIVYLPVNSDTVVGTKVTYTDDGLDWSEPVDVYQPGWSFWKPRSFQGIHYVVADVMTGTRRLELLRSRDGLKWTKVSTIAEGNLTETDLVFLDDGTAIAVARQGYVYKATPPYTKWIARKAPHLSGPAVARVANTILASGRIATANFPDGQQGERRTALFTIDPVTLKYTWKMNMVTQWGGDLSYPHILPLGNDRALLAWYDGERYQQGVPKRADIFMAVLRLLPGRSPP